MKDIDQARNLLVTLKELDKAVSDIEKDMTTGEYPYLEQERMLLIMDISDTYEKLLSVLKRMSKDKNNTFIVNRLKKQAELIIGGVQTYDSNTSHWEFNKIIYH